MVPIRAGRVWAGSTLWVSTFRLPTATQARRPPKPCSCCPEVSGRHIFISSWLCFWVLQKGFHGVGWTVDPGEWGDEWPPLQMGEGGIVWGQGRNLCPDVGIGSLGSPLKACPWNSQSFLRECYFISLQTMRPEDKSRPVLYLSLHLRFQVCFTQSTSPLIFFCPLSIVVFFLSFLSFFSSLVVENLYYVNRSDIGNCGRIFLTSARTALIHENPNVTFYDPHCGLSRFP